MCGVCCVLHVFYQPDCTRGGPYVVVVVIENYLNTHMQTARTHTHTPTPNVSAECPPQLGNQVGAALATTTTGPAFIQ